MFAHPGNPAVQALAALDDPAVLALAARGGPAMQAPTARGGPAMQAPAAGDGRRGIEFDLLPDPCLEIVVLQMNLTDLAAFETCSKSVCQAVRKHNVVWFAATFKAVSSVYRLGWSDDDQAKVMRFGEGSPREAVGYVPFATCALPVHHVNGSTSSTAWRTGFPFHPDQWIYP